MVLICGVEEAGRGCVIGNMVMVGVAMEEENMQRLLDLNPKDSKLLSPAKRKAMFPEILKVVDKYEIMISTPREIDDALNSETMNLNWLEAVNSAKIINKLGAGRAILDCPSNNIPAYRDYVKNLLTDKSVEVIAEHKADINWPIVSAASIIAKVTRDEAIEDIKKEIGIDFGSGYTSDARTREFLKEYYAKFPHIFRQSWSSYKVVAATKTQKKLGEY